MRENECLYGDTHYDNNSVLKSNLIAAFVLEKNAQIIFSAKYFHIKINGVTLKIKIKNEKISKIFIL